jgi:cytochrome oxidase Cu insertion factor (SCO1/SenC/PrrC family)
MKFQNRLIAFTFIFLSSFFSFGQLENGSIAPDFNLTDINGNQHNLYSYLNQGKTVYIDFFACHCPTCWNYHSTHSLADLHTQYGPGTATDDVFVLAIELDPNNGNNEFYGISGTTQGNWVEGTTYPQFNPEGNLLTQLMNDFSVDYYPLIYAICPDKKVTLIGTKNTAQLYEHLSTCEPILDLSEKEEITSVQFIPASNSLKVSIPSDEFKSSTYLQIYNASGQLLNLLAIENPESTISISFLESGLYFANLIADEAIQVQTKIIK